MKPGGDFIPVRVLPGILYRNRFSPAWLILLLAIELLALGIWLGENGIVQINAHYLCLDCIGIG